MPNKTVGILVFTSMVIAFLVCVSNSFVVNLKGAEVDAERFLDLAQNWAAFGSLSVVVDAEFYIQFLGIFIYAFGANEFALTLIGLSVYYSMWIYYIQDESFNRNVSGDFVLYLLLTLCLFSPSVLLRIGALLREPYMLSCLFVAVLSGSKYLMTGNAKYIWISALFVLVGMFFHKAMLVFMPIFVVLIAMFNMAADKKNIALVVLLLIFLGVGVVTVLPLLSQVRGGAALSVLLTGDLSSAERVVGYKSGRDFRTTYDYGADFSSMYSVIITIFKANYYFYLSPFPWQLSKLVDVFAMIENVSRLVALSYIVKKLIKNPSRHILFVLVCYLVCNTIWAIGTSNYGTASRHHFTTLPLLVMALSFIRLNERGFSPKKARRV